MPLQDHSSNRPTAAWISRYAAGLLASTPGLQPLDAVRMAMDASAGSSDLRSKRQPGKPAFAGTHRR